MYTPLLRGIAEAGVAQLGDELPLIKPEEIASRMKDLIEQARYAGGTAMGVYRPGEAVVAADRSGSELEKLAPSNLNSVRQTIERQRQQ